MTAQLEAEITAAPAKEGDPQADSLRAELNRVYIQQGARFPMGGLILLGVLCWVLHPEIAAEQIGTWASLIVAIILIRWALCLHYTRLHPSQEALRPKMRLVVGLRLLSGFATGVVMIQWFPQILLIDRTIVSLVFFAWFATGVLLSLASPISALFFGACLIGPLATGWALHGGESGLYVALFMVASLFLVRQSTEEAHASMRNAIRTRLREEELVRRLEQRSLDLEAAMRAKSHFLAAASHDLRQPVTSMNLLLSALLASRDETALRSVAAKFEAPLGALEEILSTLLEMSRLEAGIVEVERRACTAREIVDPLVSEYRPRASAKRLQLEADVPDLGLYVDPELLRRVLRNLLDNAIKFTDFGSVSIEAHRHGHTLKLVVADTGRGIPGQAQARVFDDYFQGENPHRNRKQGLGLGLAIVRRTVALLGGQVELESRRECGARFVISLPNAIDRYDAPDAKGREDPSRRNLSLAVNNVLVVEDDGLVVDAMATLFKTLGVKARYAADAADALAQTALGRFMPNLALVDFGLPGDTDGLELIRQLKARLPRCTFLLVTGDTRPELIRRAADAGVQTLHKPVSLERLRGKLNEMGVNA